MFKDCVFLVLSSAIFVMSAIYEEWKIKGKVTRKNDIFTMTNVTSDKLFEESFLSLSKVGKKMVDDISKLARN